MIIVIDGPAGSGKSSTAKAVAKTMSIEYLDSGALYRAATWLYLKADKDKEMFFELLNQASVSFSYTDGVFSVCVNGTDITAQLRSSRVSDEVSTVAALPRVRKYTNALMREAVEQGVYIAEGRDLGTAVFKNADLKFFMSADVDERAHRRYRERTEAGDDVSLEEVRNNIIKRDQKDARRETDPLRKAPDAIEIDTTGMCFDEQVQHICSIINDQTDLTLNN